MFINPETGKVMRGDRCKRGHFRVVGTRRCQECRNARYRLRYQRDAVYREHKKAYATQYRGEFFEQFGYPIWHLNRNKHYYADKD